MMASEDAIGESMRGQVLGVDTRTGQGIVAGDDGRRYAFGQDDWAHRGDPAIGMYVDFETLDNRALSLFPVPGKNDLAAKVSAPPQTDRNKYVAALLAFLFPPLGIHRFYLGRIGAGIVTLLLSLTVIGLVVTLPWALVDMIRLLVMSDRDFAETYGRR
jgi:hypothetical protein